MFDKIPQRDSVSWTTMIVGYNHIGRFENAIRLFVEMIKDRVMPTQFTMTNLLASCAATGALGVGRRVHSFVVKLGLSSYVPVANSLLNMYAKVDLALAQFEEMSKRDIVTWNSMITGYNQRGYDVEALDMFANMLKDSTLNPDKYTLASVLSACANLDKLKLGTQIHAYIIRIGGNSHLEVIAFTALLDGYAKLGDVTPARQIFDSLRDLDVVAWTAMIVGYVQNGLDNDAVQLFNLMLREGPKPNSYTLAAMLSVASTLASLNHGKQIHASAIRSGEVSSVSTGNALINMYAKAGSINDARRVFNLIHWDRDTVSWTSMIMALAQHGLAEEAIELFEKMLTVAIKPDHITYVGVLSACIHVGMVEQGRKQRGNSHLEVIAFTALLDGYAKLGDVTPARQIFDSLRDLDVVAWTAMIVGYVQNGLDNDAVQLFNLMLREGPKPNSYTLAAMLSVASTLASLNHGKQIHASAIRSGEVSSVSTGNALINMYAKAGSINDARRVFNLIHWDRDTVSWTSMIMALAQHGLAEEAIELFEKMLTVAIKPDHITYVGVLSACIHVGMVEQGRSYYSMMTNVHKIEPTPSHYACMIDLYGRAGLLQEAHDFIESMPIEPDVIAWGSLLSSCRVYKNVELGKLAAEKLLLIDPGNSGAYSALANLYSACGRWEDAARIRKSMKDGGVRKEQGFSWVQIQNKVHVFGVEDGFHPQKDEIYKMMEKIWKEIKKLGFVPDSESVLHDLEEELKEQILRHHSEKLAIAFGLISTPENTTLRIMKNLRICNDCHSAIKFISQLVCREIIVRDSTRFHHFKDGLCSCHDY
ncbi:PPR domain-containing protein/PPR_2 domain-containing protein/TPR_7 domain-containing protein/DYW_deaminase domain-containing protein, partial [Cephalotus follicularis]